MTKIVAIDLDETLFTTEKTISEKNKKAIADCMANDVKVVIATGRPFQGVKPILKELDLLGKDTYLICYNGALIYDLKNEHLMYASSFPATYLKELYQESLSLGVNIHAFLENQQLITPKQSEYTDVEARLNKITYNIVDFNAICSEEKIIKMMLVDPQEILDTMIPKLNQEWYQKFSVVRSATYFLEFLHPDAQKGIALMKLAEFLKVPVNQTYAIGDAENDRSMIELAGTGIVMENGFESLKKIADFITKTNDQDGVAHAIYSLILGL